MPEAVIYGKANAQQKKELEQLSSKVAAQSKRRNYYKTGKPKIYFVGFDGTWNNRYDINQGPETNVSLIETLAQRTIASVGGKSTYYQGVGTSGKKMIDVLDGATGTTVSHIAREAASDFQSWARAEFENDSQLDIRIGCVSFSRGAIAHTEFLNNIYDEGVGKKGTEIYEEVYDEYSIVPLRKLAGYREYWIKPNTLLLGSHFMIDRVAGKIRPDKRKRVLPCAADLEVIHIRAKNEYRLEFASESLQNPDTTINPRFTEIDVAGAHSNLGGGYDKNGIADYILEAGIQFFRTRGLNLDAAPLGHQIGDQALNINNSYADWTNSAYGKGKQGDPGWADRTQNTRRYQQCKDQ